MKRHLMVFFLMRKIRIIEITKYLIQLFRKKRFWLFVIAYTKHLLYNVTKIDMTQ